MVNLELKITIVKRVLFYSGMTQLREIEERSSLTPDEFSRDYLLAGKPVIVRGFANDWPACNWTTDLLRAKAGDNLVNVRRKTNCAAYKTGQKYNIERMKFSHYIDNLERNNEKSKSSYLAVQNIKQAFPQLEGDISTPELVGKVHGGPFLWIAPFQHYEFCHFDPDDNILIVLVGQKRVKLYGCDIEKLYPNPLGSKGRTVQSQVFCEKPDYNQFPLFAEAECYECLLDAGDLLYFPAFWWHQVTSVQISVSMNIFFGDAGPNNYLEKIMNSNQWPAFRYWLLNIIEQNRTTERFQKVLACLRDSIHNFILKQWHEYASTEQLALLVKVIMEYLEIDSLPDASEKPHHPPPLKIRGLLWRS